MRNNNHEKLVWMHAVSVGEVVSTTTLIDQLHLKGLKVFLSTTTKTGYETALKMGHADHIFFFPFDFPWIMHCFFKELSPSLIILLESELWPNLIWMAHRRNIPVIVLNGRISKKS
ncbi:MAG: 3-deoxy-D-manno-octulosonic acid transferase, partial [Deltaproteobacteria bacterium]|nr:3-deoxy-D-manno-octulosonic acid transferase [Deltaproteobacteria bacterium]